MMKSEFLMEGCLVEEMADPFASVDRARPDHRRLYRGPSPEPMPSTVELGRRFRTLREQEGMSVAAIAKMVGSNPGRISSFEREGKVSAELLLRLVDALSSATDVKALFTAPKFRSIQHVVKHARRTRS